MKHTDSGQDGFTMVEAMVSGLLLVSFGLMALTWLSNTADLWWTSSSQSVARATVEQATHRMTSELRVATRTGSPAAPGLSIPAPPGNTSITFYVPKDIDGNGLVIDASGNTEWDLAGSVQYVYDAATQRLNRVQNGQTTVLANGVTAAQFNDSSTDATIAANEVRVTLTLAVRTPQGRTLTATSTEVVKVRN